MICKVSADGVVSFFDMPVSDKLIRAKVGGPTYAFNWHGLDAYVNEDANQRGLPLNVKASQLLEIATSGNLVITGDNSSPLTQADIALIFKEIEARKDHNIIYPPADHETYY